MKTQQKATQKCSSINHLRVILQISNSVIQSKLFFQTAESITKGCCNLAIENIYSFPF